MKDSYNDMKALHHNQGTSEWYVSKAIQPVSENLVCVDAFHTGIGSSDWLEMTSSLTDIGHPSVKEITSVVTLRKLSGIKPDTLSEMIP